MQISKYTGCTERSIRLGKALVLLLGAFMLLSCSTQPEVWDPLQDHAQPSATGIDRTAVKLTPAMAALIKQADEKIDYQQWPEAVVILERALRINPKQAEAWTRMAVVYLGKFQPEQAIQMAKKSNALSKNDRALKSYNWTLMSRAYEQLNQSEKARHAAEQSRHYGQETL